MSAVRSNSSLPTYVALESRSATGALRDGLADAAETHDPECGAMHVLTEHLLEERTLPFRAAQVILPFGHAAAGGDDHSHRVIGDAVGQHARGIAYHHATPGAGLDIDVVVAYRRIAHRLHRWAQVQKLAVHAV